LKNGSIEEYILNTLDFDLMFLTPIDLFDFLVCCWDGCMPKCSDKKLGVEEQKNLTSKLRLYGYAAIKDLVTNQSGHAISLKFLPSMVAAKALDMAWQTILEQQKLPS
jgi:hypothetical protein